MRTDIKLKVWHEPVALICDIHNSAVNTCLNYIAVKAFITVLMADLHAGSTVSHCFSSASVAIS